MGLTREQKAARQADAKAHAAKMAEQSAAVWAVVEANKCPECGAEIRRNLSLTGWYQCRQLGAETHRLDATKPSCDWQGFVAR